MRVLHDCGFPHTDILSRIDHGVPSHSDFDAVKLEQLFNDGTKRTARVPVFTGKCHIEGLPCVEDKFRKACAKLSFATGAEMFDNFEEVIADTAEGEWENKAARMLLPSRT